MKGLSCRHAFGILPNITINFSAARNEVDPLFNCLETGILSKYFSKASHGLFDSLPNLVGVVVDRSVPIGVGPLHTVPLDFRI